MMSGGAGTENKIHEKKDKMFSDNIVDRCNIYKNCSKFNTQLCKMLGFVGNAVDLHFQRCQVFHTIHRRYGYLTRYSSKIATRYSRKIATRYSFTIATRYSFESTAVA